MRTVLTAGPRKVITGIHGLDEITNGGLPHGRATLLHGARAHHERAVFVAFEEEPARLADPLSVRREMQRLHEWLLEREAPFIIAEHGFEVAGASQAACARGEPTLMVSFDSAPAEIVRNLASVRIRLARFRRTGLLHLGAARNTEGSAEVHFLRIRSLVRQYKIRCLVIDPISAFGRQGPGGTAFGVFSAGGEVLMGTLRWEREEAMHVEESRRTADASRKLAEFTRDEAELAARVQLLELDLAVKHSARLAAQLASENEQAVRADRQVGKGRRRQADLPTTRDGAA